jgi:poly(hydroxyalkanoate) depolymerase family esterase
MKVKLLLLFVIFAVAALMMTGLSFHAAQAASLVEITNFGNNPSGLRMYLYVPNSVKPQPPILVAVHYCTGSGPAFYSGTEFASLADQYGFIVIYPSATRSGSCFDVSSPQALTHNGGSDPVGIMSMVTYVEQHNNGDPTRVYVAGASSGGMMTNVLIGDYPDVFKAGAAFMGVPFGCFATTDGSLWNSTCSTGNLIKTPQQWGDLVRAAFPGYSGPRPRMQLWHGTADTTLNYANFGEEIKQWTNVLGVSQTPAFTDTPQATWTRTRYGGTGIGAPVEAISVQGAGHTLPMSGMAALAIQFFGLDKTSSVTSTPTITTVGPTSTATFVPPTHTPTPTSTSIGATSTPTLSSGSTCSPVNATLTAPFSFDGAGNLCWKSNNLGTYINSWNLTKLTVNGVDFTNKYAFVNTLPAKASDGYWYITYSSSVAWGHFEAK